MLVRKFAGDSAEPFKKSAAEPVAGEEAVQIAPDDEPVGADRTLRGAGEMHHRARQPRSGCLAEMHFVSRDRHPGRDIDAYDWPQLLFGAEHGIDVEQAETPNLLAPAFDAERIGNGSAEHLIAAAQAQTRVRLGGDAQGYRCPTLRRARMRDRRSSLSSLAGSPVPHRAAAADPAAPGRFDIRLGAQRVEIVEIGDPRQYRHRDFDALSQRPILPLPFGGEDSSVGRGRANLRPATTRQPQSTARPQKSATGCARRSLQCPPRTGARRREIC